ncbi:unnamed protein product [Paramecium pentaurelia]|uniref:Macro domain-containing protein n=1 Tax=Paramecium pentaurelia TaxID=43138 RepID=A0A8S1X6R8_9CILI|nr:unnamed protein product [Paramecium pentaurelia]
MGCQCCKDEESVKDRKQSELPDNWNPNRVEIINSKTKVKVVYSPGDSSKIDSNIFAVSTKGLSPLFSNQIIEAAQECLQANQGAFEYGNCYQIQNKEKKIFLVCIPMWRGGQFKENNLVQMAFNQLAKQVKECSLKQVVINEVGVRYFGYPRQVIISNLMHSFKQFILEETYLEQIIYTSNDRATIALIESQLKVAHPELFQEDEKLDIKNLGKNNNNNDVTSDLEQPLLAE